MNNKKRTKLLDNHKALKGKQSRLPDELQAKIIMSKQAGHGMMHQPTGGGLEGRMVKRHLKEICEMADELYCCIDDYDDIHEWVQVKIATVQDRLNSVHSYMMYEMNYPRKEAIRKFASIKYRGMEFPGYNQPVRNKGNSKHKKMVLAKKGDRVKLVRYGHKDYGHNINPQRKSNYLKRSAGIRNKSGQLTKDDIFSANHWARKDLWPSNKPSKSEMRKEAKKKRKRDRNDSNLAERAIPYMTGVLGAGTGYHAIPLGKSLPGHVPQHPMGAVVGGGVGYLGGRILAAKARKDRLEYED